MKNTNNQINNPNEDPNQLSDDQLDAVAGGGFFDSIKDAVKDVGEAIVDTAHDAYEGYKQIRDRLK